MLSPYHHSFSFCDKVSCSSGSSWILYATKDALELLILLPPFLQGLGLHVYVIIHSQDPSSSSFTSCSFFFFWEKGLKKPRLASKLLFSLGCLYTSFTCLHLPSARSIGMYYHVLVWYRVRVGTCVKVRGQAWMSVPPFTLIWDNISLLLYIWGYMTFGLLGFLGIVCGFWESQFRSSHLQGKCLTYRSISIIPIL